MNCKINKKVLPAHHSGTVNSSEVSAGEGIWVISIDAIPYCRRLVQVSVSEINKTRHSSNTEINAATSNTS